MRSCTLARRAQHAAAGEGGRGPLGFFVRLGAGPGRAGVKEGGGEEVVPSGLLSCCVVGSCLLACCPLVDGELPEGCPRAFLGSPLPCLLRV